MPGRRRQPGPPSPAAVPAAPEPARTWARGGARRAAGPAKFASPLGAEPRARPGPAPPGETERPRIGRHGGGAERGGSAPPDAACKVREENFSSREIRTAMLTAPPEARAPERRPAPASTAALASRLTPGARRLERR